MLCLIPGIQNRRGSMLFQRSDSIVGSPAKPYLHGCSRLGAEFEEMESLGSGGFGDVVKVRCVHVHSCTGTCIYCTCKDI